MDSAAQIFVQDDEQVWIPAEVFSESTTEIEVRVFNREKSIHEMRLIALDKNFKSVDYFPLRTDLYPVEGLEIWHP